MKSNLGTEEKYPLLYLIVDKDNQGLKNNKKFFDRRTGITSGAANVLEQWPGYLSTCWVSSLVTILAILSILVLFTTALSSYKFHHMPKCIPGDNPMLDNSTIHLVHGPESWNQHQLDMIEKIIQVFPHHRIHLLLIKRQTFIETLNSDHINTEKVQEVDVSTITGAPTTSANTAASRKILRVLEDPTLDKSGDIFGKDDFANELNNKDSLFGWPFFNARDFVNNFLRKSLNNGNIHRRYARRRFTTAKPKKVTNIASLLLRYPSIFVEMVTYEEIFQKTPLFLTWHHLNDETKIFAIRVLQLWQYGGLSFDLVQAKNMSEAFVSTENLMVTTENYISVKNTSKNETETKQITGKELEQKNTYIDSLLYLGYSNFQMIPGGIVTLAENGCHMETKSPCHSFFGEILFNLKGANMYTTPETIIKAALEYFLKPTCRSFRRI